MADAGTVASAVFAKVIVPPRHILCVSFTGCRSLEGGVLPWVHVDVKEDHLRRLLRNPLVGVIELIWNALDAEASDVRVSLGENELGGIDEVRVTDDGTGMTPEFAVEVFKLLGGSWKASAVRSPGERPLHGRSGEGRWKAFGIGPRVRWETVAEVGDQRMLTVIEGHANRLDGFEIGEPTETERPTGTVVTIDSFLEPPVSSFRLQVPYCWGRWDRRARSQSVRWARTFRWPVSPTGRSNCSATSSSSSRR